MRRATFLGAKHSFSLEPSKERPHPKCLISAISASRSRAPFEALDGLLCAIQRELVLFDLMPQGERALPGVVDALLDFGVGAFDRNAGTFAFGAVAGVGFVAPLLRLFTALVLFALATFDDLAIAEGLALLPDSRFHGSFRISLELQFLVERQGSSCKLQIRFAFAAARRSRVGAPICRRWASEGSSIMHARSAASRESSPKATDFTPELRRCLKALPPGAQVLDVGCLGWKLVGAAPSDARHSGVDFQIPDRVPEGVTFRECDVDKEALPFDDDAFDLVVASHLLEHLHWPLHFAAEMARVCKPGGRIYLECPSDAAARPAPRGVGKCAFLNFWDDPTHVRPWPARALYRLFLGYGLVPETAETPRSAIAWLTLPFARLRYALDGDQDRFTGHFWKASGFVSVAVGRKPTDVTGARDFRYISLKGVTERQAESPTAVLPPDV